MTTLQEFGCEVRGLVTTNPIHSFVIRCGDSDLTVYRWNSETANGPGARHYCGEGHAEVYISRWFDADRLATTFLVEGCADNRETAGHQEGSYTLNALRYDQLVDA